MQITHTRLYILGLLVLATIMLPAHFLLASSHEQPNVTKINSQTYEDPDAWYNTLYGVFSWTEPLDVTRVAVDISQDPENQPAQNPDTVYDAPVNEFVVEADAVTQGVQYVNLSFENQAGWELVASRKLQIDTIAPEPFSITVATDTAQSLYPRLSFETTDETSGVASYELIIKKDESIMLSPAEVANGYVFDEGPDSTYTVKAVAIDKAGNRRESVGSVQITKEYPVTVEVIDKKLFPDTNPLLYLSVLLLLIVLVLQSMCFRYTHKKRRAKEEQLRRETADIKHQMEKIFSALRDEIYDQINTITKRKKLSANEEKAAAGLAQALEISETLIGKEIDDVKTILK